MIAQYKRPSILETIPRDRHAVIEASAGTGKTFTIEHIVVDLLLRENVALNEILVLTFTERAADELRQRIRSKIEEILGIPDDDAPDRGERTAEFWWIDGDARQRLRRALQVFDTATIGTIHGFFGRVLTEHAFTNGRLFVGTLEDGRTLFDRGFKAALRRSLARPGDTSEMFALWLEQCQSQSAIEDLESLLWKCHDSHRRILPPFSIEEFRREIDQNPLFEIDLEAESERFKKALQGAGIKHAGTLKAILDRLKILADSIGRSGRSATTLLDKYFQKAVGWIGEKICDRDLGEPRAAEIAATILRLRGSLVSLEAALVQTGLPIVHEFLDRQKATSGEFDFDDLIMGVARALHDPGRGEDLTQAMRARYRFALIDEFQDTDELQWSFFERVFIHSGGQNILYLIGDPKQAIYGFRGADVFTYIEARELLSQIGSPRVPLIQNFRSSSALIRAYNHILDPSATPPFFDGEIQYDQPVEAGRELVAMEADGSPAVPIYLLKIEPKHAGYVIGQ